MILDSITKPGADTATFDLIEVSDGVDPVPPLETRWSVFSA